ncbi:host attachment protein [Billgrantia antri]|uniref:host attachment protein n=1 Tax=Billgrantia antri TaxID=2846777 RepID=UPI003B22398F
MPTTWVMIADQSRARIFEMTESTGAMTEKETMVNPQGRLKDKDLGSDRPGRAFDTMGAGRHAMGKHHTPKEQSVIRFAHLVAEYLDTELHKASFERLVISAPPHFMGLLKQELSESTLNSITLALDKGLANLDAGEIRTHLPERL